MRIRLGEKHPTRELEAVVDGNTTFALDLYDHLRHTAGSLFLSPYSISTALAMTYGGAHGPTEEQMANVLHFPVGQDKLHRAFAGLEERVRALQQSGHVRLAVANAVWPHSLQPLLREYIRLVRDCYGVSITPLDYSRAAEEGRRRINAWVEQETQERIKDLIGPGQVDATTRFVLTSAIYFKGDWEAPFDREATRDLRFWQSGEKAVEVSTMFQIGRFGYAATDGLEILELQYAGGELSMVVLLPQKRDGLPELEQALSRERLAQWAANVRRREVEVYLPRFTIEARFELADTLQAMGMVDAFYPNRADFSGMDGRPGWLYIGHVIHQAFSDVNEEGTEAAAATAVVGRALAAAAPTPVFRADHPFLFLIRDNIVGSVLFLGRFVGPRVG